MLDFLDGLFQSDFMPHGHCYRWQPEILWLHVGSDALITLAYYAIPFVLIYFVSRRRDLAFRGIFVLFGLFILLCGTTHLLEIWSVWHGTYRLTGSVKFVTALVSMGTAVALVPLVPEALRLPSPGHLQAANEALQREIAEREQAQEDLASFFDLSSDLFCIADGQGRFTRVNPAFERVLGYTPGDLLGRVISDIVVEEDQAASLAHYERLRAGEAFHSFEVRLRTKDGAVRWFAWSAQPGPEGSFYGVGHEITARKEAQDELRETADLLRTFAEALPGLALLIDEDGRYVEVFARKEDLLYARAEELKGRLLTEVLPSEEAASFLQTVHQVIETGEAVHLEYPLDVQGGLRWFEGRGAPLAPIAGHKPMVVWIVHDVTERKHAEAERERLVDELEAKNAELERFTYTVSHDLKAPLVTIQGFVGLLERDARQGHTERIDEDVAYIRDAAETMRQLLDELLELSRIGRLVNAPEPVPLSTLAHDALGRLGGAVEQAGAHVSIDAALPVVYGDRTRLLEVLQNLIANAIKFSGPEPAPRVHVGARHEGEETVFFVRDNGIGIDPSYHEKIFGLFERLGHEVEGTGIGLALVRRIVEVHGGRIWVESEGPGAGSTFCFTLPLYQPIEAP